MQSFDAAKLISLIKPRPTIWNYLSPEYNDKEQRRIEWMAVCKEMVPDFDEKTKTAQHAIVTSFQRHWKVRRDGFLRSIKNIQKRGPSAKRYAYHNELLFMVELYNRNNDKEKETNQDSDPNYSPEATSEVEDVLFQDAMPVVNRRTKRKSGRRQVSLDMDLLEPKAPSLAPEEALIEKITNYIENEERAKQGTENDEDKLFLLSLLSDFKSVPEELKLDAKFDILNVLRHYRNIGGKSSRVSASKRPKRSAAASKSAREETEFCYVKCEDETEEED